MIKFQSQLYLILILFITQNAFAQVSANKPSTKKMSKALTLRYERDKKYSNRLRTIDEDENWKRSWIGKNKKNVFEILGAPTKSYSDGNGGEILAYEKISTFSGGSYTPAQVETTPNGFGKQKIMGQQLAKDTRWSRRSIERTTFYLSKESLIKNAEHYINNNY